MSEPLAAFLQGVAVGIANGVFFTLGSDGMGTVVYGLLAVATALATIAYAIDRRGGSASG